MTRITVAKGNGIGPEIMNATLAILLAADAQIEVDEIEVGEQVYLASTMSGITTESWDVIRRNRVLLKAPITTPQGGGYRSLNVTIRNMITNRGIKVWPNGFRETFYTDHWRCRFLPTHGEPIDKAPIISLLTRAFANSIDTIKTENL